ncbi:hypothetical protein LTR08_003183 [Meristemomyces frigidus]|nr:hypothetical protein LTR08_003183 [Meristemomyces frigidus]
MWWRHFSILRKQLQYVSTEVKTLHEIPTTHLARVKKKADDPYTSQRIEQTLSFWCDTMVPKWQHAFSQLSADGRFAVLGLVLLATLAEACRIVGITAAFEELGQVEVEKVLMQFANEDWEQGYRLDGVGKAGEDVGEVVVRDLNVEDVQHTGPMLGKAAVEPRGLLPQTAPAALQLAGKRKTIRTEERASKKRRKGNAIDDLFSGLG